MYMWGLYEHPSIVTLLKDMLDMQNLPWTNQAYRLLVQIHLISFEGDWSKYKTRKQQDNIFENLFSHNQFYKQLSRQFICLHWLENVNTESSTHL